MPLLTAQLCSVNDGFVWRSNSKDTSSNVETIGLHGLKGQIKESPLSFLFGGLTRFARFE